MLVPTLNFSLENVSSSTNEGGEALKTLVVPRVIAGFFTKWCSIYLFTTRTIFACCCDNDNAEEAEDDGRLHQRHVEQLHEGQAGAHVIQRIVVLAQRTEARRAIAVQHVRRGDVDGIREMHDGLVVILGFELRVAELLFRVRHRS